MVLVLCRQDSHPANHHEAAILLCYSSLVVNLLRLSYVRMFLRIVNCYRYVEKVGCSCHGWLQSILSSKNDDGASPGSWPAILPAGPLREEMPSKDICQIGRK